MKTRMLDCVRSDGKSVNLKYCEEVRGCCVMSLRVNSSLIISIHAEPSDLTGALCSSLPADVFGTIQRLLNTLLKRDTVQHY